MASCLLPDGFLFSGLFWDFGSLYQRRCGVISYALSRQPYLSSLSLRRLWLRVAAQASRTSHSRCFCISDVEASSFTSCCGRRVFFSERRCGVTVCLQSRGRQRVLPFRPWYRRAVHYDRGIAPRASRGCLLSRHSAQGVLEIKALGWLFSRPGSRFPEIKSTRLLIFCARHKVASGQKHKVAYSLCKAQGCLWQDPAQG